MWPAFVKKHTDLIWTCLEFEQYKESKEKGHGSAFHNEQSVLRPSKAPHEATHEVTHKASYLPCGAPLMNQS